MKYKISLCNEFTCTQCFACKQVCPQQCISFEEVGAGFFIPKIDRTSCIECGACMRACHQLSNSIKFQTPQNSYACWTTNINDRENSSSGGAFSSMAHQVLSSGGVVFGATMTNELKVVHKVITHEYEIKELQGSKYVQSDISNCYVLVKQLLNKRIKVLFTGTPCQISGLYTYLKTNPTNLITCDVVCHGVPSQKAFDFWIDKTNIRKNSTNISFRFTKGWGFQVSRDIISKKNINKIRKQVISPFRSYYLRAFNKGLMFNEPCYNCKYAQRKRVSDLTIADYWGIGSLEPFNYPKHKGISMLLINTIKGQDLISSCSTLFMVKRPLSEAIQGNANLNLPSNRPSNRDSYFGDSKCLSILKIQKKYHIEPSLRDYLRILKQLLNSFR